MVVKSRLMVFFLCFALSVAALVAACGGSSSSASNEFDSGGGGNGLDSGLPDGQNEISITIDGGSVDGAHGFDVEPSTLQTIKVQAGQHAPTVTFKATLDGQPINAGWTVDRGDIGTMPSAPASSGVFTPSGAVGGLVTVTAGLNGKTVQRQILVKITDTQDGADPNNTAEQPQIATSVGELTSGGGVGGVGGEGLGQAVNDPTVTGAFNAPAGNGQAQGLTVLYPYDKTVFPRGLLAPLIMWDWSVGDADAVKMQLSTTSGSFSWTGTFGRPAILSQTGGKFIRMPIPEDVWDMATNSAGGTTSNGAPDQLTLELWVEQGGHAYGPVSETWTIAPARLSGIIYYGSYGTKLAQNYSGAVGGNGMFGGAVLSIHVGDTGPALVAGSNGGAAQCRVCHSVSADGSRLVVQHGDNGYATSSAYDLTPTGATEHVLATGATFPAVYPDGSMALSPNGQLLPLPDDTTPIVVTGLAAVATNLGTPAFSPDGKLVAFNPMAGPGVTNPTQKLLVMNFDETTDAFSNPVTVADFTGQPAATRPGWPAFFPDGKSIVFHEQLAAGADGNGAGDLYTRKGAEAQIAWTSSSANNATVLNELNGLDASGNSYLPKLAAPINMSCTGDGTQVGNIDNDHKSDTVLNYEPTVNPVASGGYVWVVFTSRRMYGSVATIPPFCSDPRGVDLVQNITPKKLWVSAVDLSGKSGTDPSHPAFYLPGQELLAGNMRAFWVLEPCRADGASCQSGDQCCNGYCEPSSEGGGLTCTQNVPTNHCSSLNEKCTTAADCCDSTNLCVNGFCTQKGPS
jgi:WD40-like Beta Propeller Repeat